MIFRVEDESFLNRYWLLLQVFLIVVFLPSNEELQFVDYNSFKNCEIPLFLSMPERIDILFLLSSFCFKDLSIDAIC